MWLSNSSVGRKFVMALTGAFLVLFVTFHCLMNAVAILWPAAYNSVCEFLGANWYALIGSAVIAVFIILHVIYAVWLTLQNRKARGNQRYSISRRPADVEWSSQNMLVLGLVILAFLVVHLIQFWAKMQLQEIRGGVESIPPAAGTLFLQKAFELPWTLIVYVIGFCALWFHLNHGMWSMFQSVGWNNKTWLPRLKKIALWWTSIVVFLFLAEGVVFTVRAAQKFYLTDETLRDQYKEMVAPMLEKDFGPDAANFVEGAPYDQVSAQLRQIKNSMDMQLQEVTNPNSPYAAEMKNNPEMKKRVEDMKNQAATLESVIKLFDYLESADNQPANVLPPSMGSTPY